MKKTIIVGILMLMSFGTVFAQADYKPRETWPFLYEEFQPGNIRFYDGTLLEDILVNVALHDGTLMYLDKKEVIMRPDMSKVRAAKVGKDVYMHFMGKMYKVLSELDLGCVLLGSAIDVDEQNKVNIGYGITSTSASSQNLSLVMDGRFDMVNKSIQQISIDRFRGNVLPVEETYYLLVGGSLIPASRQEIVNLPGVDKKEAASFFKQEKIKWKETASLEKLVVFVSSQISK